MEPILLGLLQVVYLMLPGVLGNMAPVLVKKLNILNYPLDHKKKFRGERLFGNHKTYRGVLFAVAAAILMFWVQSSLYIFPFFRQLSLIEYPAKSFILWGGLMGLGVMAGDATESFFKRQEGIKPGKPWFPWDQIDSVLGGLVFIIPVFMAPLWVWISAVVLSLVLHILIRHTAYYLGITKSKW